MQAFKKLLLFFNLLFYFSVAIFTHKLFCLFAFYFSLSLAGQPDPNVERCDSRVEILKEDQDLASSFIQTLFAVLYEVYSSSVSKELKQI